MKTTQQVAREAMIKHGVSSRELSDEMKSQGLCAGREQEVIDRLVDGGPLAMGLALALFGIIGRQSYLPKTIH
ncbi:MAG: hypothetical protein K2Q12_07330 [Rickettsiales bacterium]|nr:hypothetical protein [Rickettsiales bacterium]